MIVVEAAGGYGKTVLAAELVDAWRYVGIGVELDHVGVSASLLAVRLNEAVQRAGYTDAAGAAAKQDPTAAVDALVSALTHERCAFVIDDAHYAAADAGRLIVHLAGRLEADQRLVVLARQLPEGASRLRRAEYFQLSASDLALDLEETMRVCRAGFGLDVSADAARVLDRATSGWTAATVLAAARAARTGEAVTEVAAAATNPSHPAGAVGAILEEALVELGPSRRSVLAQIARMPLIDPDLVATISGDPEFFTRALAVGIPFSPARGTWWDLPGPVREHLATFSPTDRVAMRSAAETYRQQGELGPALELLLACGATEDAAAMVAAIPPDLEETLDIWELQARFGQLPAEAVDNHPEVLVLVARRLGHANLYERCCVLLGRAEELARGRGDSVLQRSVEAELVKVRLLAGMQYAAAADKARQIMATAAEGEDLTRARLNEFLGYALCHLVDSVGRRDEAHLIESEECFARATTLYRALGMRSAVAFIAVDWAVYIQFPRGRLTAAMERIEDALVLLADRPRAIGFVKVWRALFAAEMGQDELCRRCVDEVFEAAERINSPYVAALGHWRLAVLSSYQGDAEAAVFHVRQVEERRGNWWPLQAGEFLAEAADLLDRVGHVALAADYLVRAKGSPADAVHLVALADAALEARHGDPMRAEAKLTGLIEQRVDRREEWRVTLLRAFAAFRRGEHEQAGALASTAFEEAARIGQPQAPLIRERAITEQLLGLATRTGQPAALALEASSLPMALALLGRFQLTVGGKAVALGHGQEVRLLKFVAARGGHVHAEEAIESMWPEVALADGRNRLRTVLNRLRNAAGDVIERSGELLELSPALSVDFTEFLSEAERALSLASSNPPLAVAMAHGAMARYRGELLPDDRYEDWAEKPRVRARHTAVGLLDLCAAHAAERGDLDALRRIVEQTIEFSPYDDSRYLQAASALVEQGRRGEALSVLDRARSALAEIGLEPYPALVDLERAIGSLD